MGIKNVGFQGQDMDEKVYETISAIRAKYPELPISVDGGVTLENAGDLVDAGATRLVSGSAIFGSNNPKEAIDYLKSL
jgi:ribulose-phosphate 3-epimerase